MKTKVFFVGVGAVLALAMWGCQFNTVDRASQYEGQYDASLPPPKDGGDAAKPDSSSGGNTDAGEDEDGGSQDAGDAG